MPPTGRASSAASLTPSTKLGPPAEAIWYRTKSSDTSEAADVYTPAMADSRSWWAGLDNVFLSSHSA